MFFYERMDANVAQQLTTRMLGDDSRVFSSDGRYFIGRVTSTGQLLCDVVVRSAVPALLVLGEGASWEDALRRAGILSTSPAS